jgi:hypothetical protein
MLSTITQLIITTAISAYFIWIGTVADLTAPGVSTADIICYCIITTISVVAVLLQLTILLTKGK